MKKKGLKSRPLPRKTVREYTPPKGRRPKGAIFRWGFMLFVAAWMFVLGIIVGRYATPVDFDPKRIEKELAELRAAEIQKEKERLKAEAKALYDMDLDFYEDLKRPVFAALPRASTSPAEDPMDASPAPPTEIKRSQSTKHNAPARQERKVVSPAPAIPQTPASAPSEPKPVTVTPKLATQKPPEPAPAKPRNETGQFAIQVASFVAASDADRTVVMLKRRGYFGAYRTEDNVPGLGKRYRVRIGQFRDSTSAREVLTQLRSTANFRDAYMFKQ